MPVVRNMTGMPGLFGRRHRRCVSEPFSLSGRDIQSDAEYAALLPPGRKAARLLRIVKRKSGR